MLKVSAFYLEKKNITKGNIFSAIVNIKTKKLCLLTQFSVKVLVHCLQTQAGPFLHKLLQISCCVIQIAMLQPLSYAICLLHQIMFEALHVSMGQFFCGPIFLRRFRLYVLSFMFRFMFANICFEKNENSKIYVMLIINIT